MIGCISGHSAAADIDLFRAREVKGSDVRELFDRSCPVELEVVKFEMNVHFESIHRF
jgi:hypothetical protein